MLYPSVELIQVVKEHSRMTENSRLATAAAAMKHRMMTRNKALVLWLFPNEAANWRGPELASVAVATAIVDDILSRSDDFGLQLSH